jgi:hypothetical protein
MVASASSYVSSPIAARPFHSWTSIPLFSFFSFFFFFSFRSLFSFLGCFLSFGVAFLVLVFWSSLHWNSSAWETWRRRSGPHCRLSFPVTQKVESAHLSACTVVSDDDCFTTLRSYFFRCSKFPSKMAADPTFIPKENFGEEDEESSVVFLEWSF